MKATFLCATAIALLSVPALAAADTGPTDPQIAHIAYTAGNIDIAAAKLALSKTRNPQVREFARTMLRDHEAVNKQALALLDKLHVKPEANGTSAGLSKQADATRRRLSKLSGKAFDREYARNEVAYHGTVNGALEKTLIPSSDNGELKELLKTGLTLFREHQDHARHLSARLK